MWRCWSLALLGASVIVAQSRTAGFGQDAPSSTPAPIGFAPGSRAAEARAEAHALGVPTPNNARSWLRTLTEEPHVAGTPADHKTALFVRDKLREWGWKADISEYEVLLNYPVPTTKGLRGESASSTIELVRPNPQNLPTNETPLFTDKDSDSRDAFPAFHGYGASGDVVGQVVYANYGRPEDFAN